MMNALPIDQLVSRISLDYPPIGLARVAKRPADVDMWAYAVTSACLSWRFAATGR